MFPLALLQATESADVTSSCVTFVITWAPFAILVAIWMLYLRRMGYFGNKRGYVQRSEEHMDRVEQTLSKIEEHLRKIAERDQPP